MSEKDGGGDQMEWWSVRLRERWRFVCVCVFLCEKKKKRNQSGRDILRDCVVGNRWLGGGSRGGF